MAAVSREEKKTEGGDLKARKKKKQCFMRLLSKWGNPRILRKESGKRHRKSGRIIKRQLTIAAGVGLSDPRSRPSVMEKGKREQNMC